MRFGYVGFGIYINLADAWRDVAVQVVSQSLWAIGNGNRKLMNIFMNLGVAQVKTCLTWLAVIFGAALLLRFYA